MALASSNLGRVEARAHNHEVADRWLQEAVEGFEAIGAAAFVLEARVRLAENLMFQGDRRTEATARELLATASETLGASVIEATLHRILGYALWQDGDRAGSREAFEASLEKARAADAPYEIALTRHALADLLGDDGQRSAADEIFDRMGVSRVPEVPV